jgi:Transposase DDE domain
MGLLSDPLQEGTMCRYHSTLDATAVRADARGRLVRGLQLRDCGQKLSAERLADLLLLMAGWGLSLCGLFAVLRGLRCCYETARLALRANLPDHDVLLDRLRGCLLDVVPARLLRRRDWDVAIDLHDVPYYGDPASTPGARRGQRKAGTDKYFTFATAVLLNHGCRYTVGLLPVESPRPEPVVRLLLDQLRQAGLHVRRLLLDRGFYAAEVVRLLQQRRVPFIVPVIKRGRLGGDGQASGTLAFFRKSRGGLFTYRWRRRGKKNGPEVEVRVAVTFAPGPRGKRRRLVYAYWGLGAVSGPWLAAQYRRRFGIETSYRQLNQGLAPTSSKDRRVRLLLVGLALLLRNVWVLLHGEVLARRRGGRRVLQLHRLRLGLLLLWLGLAVAEELGLVLALDLAPGEPAKAA